MPDLMQPFTGNDIFLSGGKPVMPANAIAEKLRAGNFGPFPNQSAPPGYVLPQTMEPGKIASALRSNILPNIGGAKPPAAAPAAPASPGPGYAFYNGAWHSPESVWGNSGPPGGWGTQAFGPGGDIGYGQMGMGITGQGAFGDLGAFGTGYGDTY